MNEPGTAGQSSQRKYAELTGSWRRRNRRLFTLLRLICGGVFLASFVVARLWTGAAWTLGLFGGAALCFFLIAWWSPPGWIEHWQQGAWGEQATANALRALEHEGWVVLHDLTANRGNVDHVVIGPGGVFLLDTKRLAGSVTVENGRVTVTRFDDSDLSYTFQAHPQLLALAREAHDRIRAATRINLWVTPVLVLWSDFRQREFHDTCTFLHGEELVDWLRRQPQAIAPGRVPQIAQAVLAAWNIAPATRAP